MSCNYLSPLDFQMIIQVRKYSPFLVVEAKGDKLAGSTGFNDVTGWVSFTIQFSYVVLLFSWVIWMIIHLSRYIFGKNSKSEKIPMTTPVFTQAYDAELSKVSIQIVLPLEKDISRWGSSYFFGCKILTLKIECWYRSLCPKMQLDASN